MVKNPYFFLGTLTMTSLQIGVFWVMSQLEGVLTLSALEHQFKFILFFYGFFGIISVLKGVQRLYCLRRLYAVSDVAEGLTWGIRVAGICLLICLGGVLASVFSGWSIGEYAIYLCAAFSAVTSVRRYRREPKISLHSMINMINADR